MYIGEVLESKGDYNGALYIYRSGVFESDKIDQLIDLISETDTPIPVTSANGKKLVGEIDRTIVMKAMSSRS